MYGWIWRHLPGSVAIRTAQIVLLLIIVGLLLWLVVYPWASVNVPIDQAGVS